MPSLKFIHTADLHLDSPFRGLSAFNPELATRIKEATFNAFEKIIDACIQEKVDFLLISGDAFDREEKSLGAQLIFLKQLNRLSQHAIQVYIICGNHDPLSSWLSHLPLPDHVHRFASEKPTAFRFSRNNEPLADILGISYQDKALTENIALQYERPENPAPFCVALLHGNLSGAKGHDNYAPFTLADLQSKSVDYWALGHIHQHQILHPSQPVIAYPGNPQGRDFGEKGPKGCLLVTLSDEQKPSIHFLPTHWVRFDELTIDVTDLQHIPQLIEHILNEMDTALKGELSSSVIRLALTGRTSLHQVLTKPSSASDIMAQLNEGQLQYETFRYVDSLQIATSPAIDLEKAKQGNDFLAAMLRAFDPIELDPDLLDDLIGQLGASMTIQLRHDDRQLTETDKQRIVQQARSLLLDLLTNETT